MNPRSLVSSVCSQSRPFLGKGRALPFQESKEMRSTLVLPCSRATHRTCSKSSLPFANSNLFPQPGKEAITPTSHGSIASIMSRCVPTQTYVALLTHTRAPRIYPSQFLPHRVPPSSPSPLRGWSPYSPTLVPQVSVRLGASSHTEVTQGSPVGDRVLQLGYSFRESLHFTCWGAHKETELHVCYTCCVFFGWWLSL